MMHAREEMALMCALVAMLVVGGAIAHFGVADGVLVLMLLAALSSIPVGLGILVGNALFAFTTRNGGKEPSNGGSRALSHRGMTGPE